MSGRQGKSGGGQNDHYQQRHSIASPVPIVKSADLEMDGRETSGKFLCLWAARSEQNNVANRLQTTPSFVVCGPTHKP